MEAVSRLPTVEEWREWQQVGPTAVKLAEELRPAARRLQSLAGDLVTVAPIGYYLDRTGKTAAVRNESGDARNWELETAKRAAERAIGTVHSDPPSAADIAAGRWIKAAYSPFLEDAKRWLSFVPDESADEAVISPGPVTGGLTTGILGAGLGYGTGYLLEQVLPRNWKRGRLRKTLATLGATPGLAAGGLGAWGNAVTDRSLNDSELLEGGPGEYPLEKASSALGGDEMLECRYHAWIKQAARRYGEALEELAGHLKEAIGDVGFAAGQGPQQNKPGPLDINVDSLGRTLWETGAKPDTSGTTMGAVHAAKQMPGSKGPDWATPQQMGQLAAGMGTGYASGALVGGALGALTGMPQQTQDTLKRTGMYLGVVESVVPKMFGQQ